MTFKESYQSHKAKCIKNASRIEAAISQLTNLKEAENFVMTGKEVSEVVFTNATGVYNLPVETLNRNKHGNAHVCRFDKYGHAEYYYISFSSKKYQGAETFRDQDTYWILSKSQLKNTNLIYILVTDDGLYTADPSKFKPYRKTASLTKENWITLNNTEEKTYLNFTYLQMVDPVKGERTLGSFRVTFILPSGNTLHYEGTSKRDLYKKIFEAEELKQIDAISYNTFGYHFNKGTDWIIENGDKRIIAKFYQDTAERSTKGTKKVKTIGEIEQIINEEIEKDETFLEDMESAVAYDPKIINKWLQRQPAELRTVASLRNYLNDPSLWSEVLSQRH